MHKDIKVAELEVYNARISGCIRVYNADHMPVGTHTKRHQLLGPLLQSWQSMRMIPQGRDRLSELIRNIGMTVQEAYMRSNGLSLTDCYWFTDNNGVLKWEDVSFLRNGFVSDVGGILGKKTDSNKVSPDFSTDGMLQKTWVFLNGIPSLVKIPKAGQKYTCINEVIASRIADIIGVEHVPYYFFKLASEKAACICPSFIEEDRQEFVCALAYRHEFLGTSTALYDALARMGLEDFLQKMTAFDLLIGNTDRHERNFGYLRDPDTLEFIGPAPLFDSGFCLHRKYTGLSYMKPFGNDRKSALRYLRGIPFAMPSEKELASIIENVYMEAGFHERIDGAVEEILENRKELLKYANQEDV